MSGITIPFKINHYISERVAEDHPDLEEGSAEFLQMRDKRVSALVRYCIEQIPNKDSLTSSELDLETQKQLDLWVVPPSPLDFETIGGHLTPQTIVAYAREQVLVDTPDIDQTSTEYAEAAKNKEIEVLQSIIDANPYDPDTLDDTQYDLLIRAKLQEWQPPQ